MANFELFPRLFIFVVFTALTSLLLAEVSQKQEQTIDHEQKNSYFVDRDKIFFIPKYDRTKLIIEVFVNNRLPSQPVNQEIAEASSRAQIPLRSSISQNIFSRHPPLLQLC